MSKYEFKGGDAVKFAKIMATLCAAYDKTLTDELQRTYELALADSPVDEIGRRALRHIQTEKWFPRPSELRRVGAAEYVAEWKAKALESKAKTRADNLRIAQRQASPPAAIEAKPTSEFLKRFRG